MRRFIALLLVLGFMLLTLIEYPAAMTYRWARAAFSVGFLLLAA